MYSDLVDIEVSIYDEDGELLISSKDYSPTSSFSVTGDGNVYIKVEPYSNSSTAYYYLDINGSSSIPVDGTVTTTGGTENPNPTLDSG